jgi:hypothetical protein
MLPMVSFAVAVEPCCCGAGVVVVVVAFVFPKVDVGFGVWIL